MRPSNTGKTDPQQAAPAKRGFFAAAGERLKRAMSGARPPAAAAPHAQETSDSADGADGEATTSIQSKARELLQQDRTHRQGSSPAATESTNGSPPRRTNPPPLPSKRTTAESRPSSPDAISGTVTAPSSSGRAKRPVRDSKSEALRARLGAAKAALAEAQAKRAAEQASASVVEARAEETKPELPALEADSFKQEPQPIAAAPSEPDEEAGEPIRTLTIARLLARQGYYDRSLSIYEELLAENTEDPDLRAEAEQVRAQQSPPPDQTR